MSTRKFTPPKHGLSAFNCPYCDAYSAQIWSEEGLFGDPTRHTYMRSGLSVQVSKCTHCTGHCLWANKKMVIPDSGQMPMPNEDLDDDIKNDYLEAASILQKSPRAAAALLRLALQKLCKQLGGKGQNIQLDIDALLEKGLPTGVLEAMDSVRILGNEAVHPGHIDLRDDVETATVLFGLINFTAEKMLTDPKRLEEFYNSLPENKRRKNNSEHPAP